MATPASPSIYPSLSADLLSHGGPSAPWWSVWCPAAASNTDSDTFIHSSTVTDTFFGYRRGWVSFCIQGDTRSSPLLLMEFALLTAYLAWEMQHGLLHITLECDCTCATYRPTGVGAGAGSLFNVPVCSMYCNGRKMGFAVRQQITKSDLAIVKLMQPMSVGAGVLSGESKSGEGDIMYLRASFELAVCSADSESFHMINSVGSSRQELSIFLPRS